MRMSWRTLAWIVAIGIWPQVGCHQVPGDKSVQDLRPIQPAGKDKKQDLTAADVAQTWMTKADKLQKEGQTDAAIAMCEKMREPGNPQAMQATRKLALIHDRNDDLDRAEQEYQRILLEDPKDAATLYRLGDLSYRRGHWGIAEKHLTKALAAKPDYPEARVALGMVLAQGGFYDASIQEFAKVLPKAEAYCELAFVLKLQGKVLDAIRAYETALTIEPTMPRATQELRKIRETDPARLQVTTPVKMTNNKVSVEVEPAPIRATDGAAREMMQRPTLPPVPDLDWPANRK